MLEVSIITQYLGEPKDKELGSLRHLLSAARRARRADLDLEQHVQAEYRTAATGLKGLEKNVVRKLRRCRTQSWKHNTAQLQLDRLPFLYQILPILQFISHKSAQTFQSEVFCSFGFFLIFESLRRRIRIFLATSSTLHSVWCRKYLTRVTLSRWFTKNDIQPCR